jgi:diguanylate cyclase (GGDEF)-like protein
VLAVLGTGLFAVAVTGVLPLPASTRDLWLYNFVWVAAAASVAARARRDLTNRVTFACLTLGLTASLIANVYYTAVLTTLDNPPYPSWSDLGFLLLYPLTYITVIRLLKARVERWHPSLWLDGVILGFGVAALGAAFVLAPVLDVTNASFAVAATNLAYPLGDLLLISTVLAGIWLLNRRIDRSWALLGAGVIAMGIGDVTYLLQDSAGQYVEGTPLDLTWLFGAVLMAAAAVTTSDTTPQIPHTRQPSHRNRRTSIPAPVPVDHGPGGARPGTRWALLAIPMTVTLVSLGLLLPWGHWQSSVVARWLAAGALCAVAARTALTYREVWDLADAQRQARTDELTGLTNRRGFTRHAEDRLQYLHPDDLTTELPTPIKGDDQGHPAGLAPTALLLLDLDRFKEVNDSLGHHAGDQLLIAIAQRLAQSCRGPHDVLARLGGDEFAVLLPDTNRPGAEHVATRIRDALAPPFLLDGVRVQASISIGIALAPQHGHTLSLLMRRADIAMYRAKATRTGHAIYDPALRDPDGEDRLQRVQNLRTAIEEHQIIVHYQPKIDLASGQVNAVEALVRWDHPHNGLLYPDAFLPLADDAGLMPALTATVLDQALAQAAAWHRDGRDLAVAINLPPAAVVDADLPDRIAELLSHHQVPARQLKLEITEESLLADRVRARDVLARLRRLGVRIAIDDYGSGYSSLAYLRELPVDELKLDRSFIHPMADDARAAAIVRSTVELAHSLGLTIVAEGVENAAAADELARYGCDGAQGFHYTHALHPTELTHWLDNRTAEPQHTRSTSHASTRTAVIPQQTQQRT